MKGRETEPGAYGFLAGAYFFLFVLILVAASCRAALVPRVARASELRDAHAVRVDVTCYDKAGFQNGGGVGSGVVLGGRRILTAHHVVWCSHEARIRIIFSDGRNMPASIEKDWPKKDVAQLAVYEDLGLARVGIVRVKSGDEVCATTAHPQRIGTCGVVAYLYNPVSCQGSKNGGTWCYDFHFASFIVPGNSGSGIYDRNGFLIGLVTGTADFAPIGYGTLLYPLADEISQ